MLVIDGNNVMGQRVGWHRDPAAARRRLVGEIAEFSRRHRQTVTVVFDGSRADDPPDPPFVRIVYSGRRSNADDAIVDLVREAPGEVSDVVTSDRELRRRVEGMGTWVMSSGRFRRMLESLPGAGC